MNRLIPFLILIGCALMIAPGCKNESHHGHDHGDGSHTHSEGTQEHDDKTDPQDDEHEHDEVPLGVVEVGDLKLELAQAHGIVEAGKESHLVVKLSYSDKGATVVRAWLGTDDRTMSMVGKGEYAPSHNDYDVHATAPDPLPADVMWWIEIEKPDGTTITASIEPRM